METELSECGRVIFILMFAHIAIIDLSLFSGASIQTRARGLERPGEASFCLIIKTAAFCEHFTDLSLPGLGLQLPTGCARLTGPDATPHHTPQPSYTLLLISPTRFCPVDSTAGPSLLTCVMQTGRVQTLRTSLQILAVIPCLPVLK